jgi:7-carboxy-7-deazaguanine synthase
MNITPVTADTVILSEVFGGTYQGEGPSLGQHASFIRFGACNLKCSWCDTPYTWDARRHDLRKELTRTHIDTVIDAVMRHRTSTVVLTGGEPLLHQDQPGWRTLVSRLDAAGKRLEIETNGTLTPGDLARARIAQFNVSPKLGNSGDPEHRRIVPGAIAALLATQRAAFKFVCATATDVDEAATFAAAHAIPHRQVWIMPMGTTPGTILDRGRVLAPRALAHGFNMTTRLHVLLWGDERGR